MTNRNANDGERPTRGQATPMIEPEDHPEADDERTIDDLQAGDHVIVADVLTTRRALFLDTGPFDCPRGGDTRYGADYVKLHEIGTDQRTAYHRDRVVPAVELDVPGVGDAEPADD